MSEFPTFACLLLFMLTTATVAADEPPSIADTNYPVPKSAWFVAPTGNDSYSGKIETPLRTISAAVNRASSGSTIVIREGVYRESIGSMNKPLVLQPYPHEKVWIKGSIAADAWVHDPRAWRLDNWKSRFEQTSYEPGEITKDHPLAGNPELAFIDGRPLEQVGSLDHLKPGTFFVDNEKHAYYVADDPRNKLLEVARYGHALELYRGASGSIIRGLGFAHYANVKHEGAVRTLAGASNIVFENNTFADNAGSSLLIYECRNVMLLKNFFLRSGYQGLSAWKTVGLTIEENKFVANNHERFATEGDYAGAAGAKIFATSDVRARNNVFLENRCTGLWFDGSCDTCKVICNRFSNNEGAGVHVEESARAIVVGNEADHNHAAGINISNSGDVRVFNNQLTDNNPGIAVQDDSRLNSNPREREQGIDYVTAHVELFNNVLVASDVKHQLLWARDYNSVPMKSATEMIAVCDYNLWQRPGTQNPRLIEWWQKRVRLYYHDMNGFRSDTKFESHGIDQMPGGKMPTGSVPGHKLPIDIARELKIDPAAAVPIGKLDCRK